MRVFLASWAKYRNIKNKVCSSNLKPKGKYEIKNISNNYSTESNGQSLIKKENRRIFMKNTIFPMIFLPCQFITMRHESAFGEILKNTSEIYKTKSGLKIIEFSQGILEKPEWGDFLIINYVMYRNDGGKLEKVDDTYESKMPFLFLHGGGQVIIGLEEAVHTMRKGGKRRVIIPQEIGYNGSALGPIPAKNVNRKKIYENRSQDSKENFFIFDIELLDIKKNNYNQKWFNNITL